MLASAVRRSATPLVLGSAKRGISVQVLKQLVCVGNAETQLIVLAISPCCTAHQKLRVLEILIFSNTLGLWEGVNISMGLKVRCAYPMLLDILTSGVSSTPCQAR